MSDPSSNQCPYCGREDGKHNEVCVYAECQRLRAERDDALQILAIALPGPRPWPTESNVAKLRIYREMALDKRRSVETSGESRQPPIKVDAENTFLQLTNNSGAPLTIVGTESVTLRPGESWPPDKTADPSLLEASQRVSAMALSAAGKHAERVVELEAEVATLREHLAEQNRLLSLNVAEVKRLKALGSPVETTAPREGIRPTTLDPTRSWAEQMNASAEKAWEPTTVEILEYARRYSLSTEEARKLLKAERASMIGAVKTKVIPCVWQSGCKNHRICDEMGCCQQLGAQNGTGDL